MVFPGNGARFIRYSHRKEKKIDTQTSYKKKKSVLGGLKT